MTNYVLYYEYIMLPLEIRLFKGARCACWISPRLLADDKGTFMDWDNAPVGFDTLKEIVKSGVYQAVEVLLDADCIAYYYEGEECLVRKRLTGWVDLAAFDELQSSTKDPNRLNGSIPTEFISLCPQ